MYFQLGYDNTSLAIKTLSHRGLKLYLFLAKNKDGEWFPLSQDNAENFTGMDENTYCKAVKELIEKGFLTETEKPSFFEAGKKAVKYYVFSVCPDMSTAEVSPANEGETASTAEIEANISKAVDGVWCKRYPEYPEESPTINENHFVFRDDVEEQLIENGVEITPHVKQLLDNRQYIHFKDNSLPF